MQPSALPRGAYPAPGTAGMLDFSRFGYTQDGMREAVGSGTATAVAAQSASAAFAVGGQAGGAYSSYLSAQQAGCTGTFPTSKPPAFLPPQPPSEMAAVAAAAAAAGSSGPLRVSVGPQKASDQKVASSSSGRGSGHLGVGGPGADLSRALLHAQPPPPPSQAPYVPPAPQAPVPQGPPPLAPPLMSPTQARELSDEERKREEMLYLTTPEAERAAREKYGLLGILKVIRMTDPDLNTLALGMDLTTLGLNLNSPECLYTTFASPWSETPARKDPEFNLPQCYWQSPPQLKTAHLQKFSLETLFYIFFNMPRDTLQACAAAELYNRGWKYHRDHKAWFVVQEEEGQQRWVCFDPNTWEKHYYMQQLNPGGFLSEDDVRITNKMSPGGQPTQAA